MPARSLGGDGAGDPFPPGGGFRLLPALRPAEEQAFTLDAFRGLFVLIHVPSAREAWHALPEYLALMGVDSQARRQGLWLSHSCTLILKQNLPPDETRSVLAAIKEAFFLFCLKAAFPRGRAAGRPEGSRLSLGASCFAGRPLSQIRPEPAAQPLPDSDEE